MRNTPYIIQIGLDYGTSYTKCIYKNLIDGKRYLFLFNTDQQDSFLLSSTVLYKDGLFAINYGNTQYPEYGINNLKMVLASDKDENIRQWAEENKLKMSNESAIIEFASAACLFYLSRVIRTIKDGIEERFPDFGDNENDDMYVNMAIPVSNCNDLIIKNRFYHILACAWEISKERSLPNYANVEDISNLLRSQNVDNEIVHVYPEISVAIHAFRNSPSVIPNSSRIYLVTDIGAGTVDQCTFTLSGTGGSAVNNYFSAKVFELGSSCIERRARSASPLSINKLRIMKESGNHNSAMLSIISQMIYELSYGTMSHTLNPLKSRLYYGPGTNPTTSLRENLVLLFTGGGDMLRPYRAAVIQAVKEVLMCDWQPRLIPMELPSILNISSKNQTWKKRLNIAFGLAEDYDNLARCMYPDETILSTPESGYPNDQQRCTCGGRNSGCPACGGTGYV